jgi:hypothetical protein
MKTLPASHRLLRRTSAACVAALLGLAAGAAQAEQDVFGFEVVPDVLGSDEVDPAVYATLLPCDDVANPDLVQTAIATAMATPDTRPKSIVPITAKVAGRMPPKSVRIDPNAGIVPSRVLLPSNQVIQVRADGLPAANGPDRDPLVRVMPRAVNPADVTFAARWGVQDRIPLPVLSQLSWDAHADLLSGGSPVRVGNVRKSWRITAQWDTPEDIAIGLTPGWQRGGGREYEHYVTGWQVTTLDKTRNARWSSWVELSGEKMQINNLANVVENATAQVQAGASYASSSATQLNFSISRSTTYTATDLQSNVGLAVRF